MYLTLLETEICAGHLVVEQVIKVVLIKLISMPQISLLSKEICCEVMLNYLTFDVQETDDRNLMFYWL